MSADIAMTPAANVELSLAPQLPLAAVEMTPQQKAAAARAVKKAKKEAALAKAHATRMSKRIAATGVVSTETLAVTANTAAATAVTPALAISDDVSVAAADDDHVKTPKTPVFADADTAEAMSTTSAAPAAAVATGHVSAVGGGIWSAPAVAATAAAAAAAVPDVKAAEAPAPAAAEAPIVVLVISEEEKAARIAWLRSVANGVACSDSAKCNGLPNVCTASKDMIAALINECKKAKTATDDKFPYCYVCQKALKTAADLDADNDCKACHVTPMCYHFSLTNSKFGANWDAKAHAVQCLVKHETSSIGYCGKCLDNVQRTFLPSGKADAVATVRRMVKAKWFKSKGQHVQHDVEVDLINPQVLATLNASHASKGAVKLEDIDTETLATIDQELVVEGHIDVNAVEEKALKKIKIDQVLGAKIRSVDICDLVDVAEGPALLRRAVAELKTFTEVNSARKVITTLKAAAATAADEKKNAEAVKPPAKKKARTEKGAIDKDTTDSDTDAEADKPKAKAKAKAKGKSATDSSSSDAEDKPKAKAKAKAVSGSKRKTFDNDEVLAAARVIMAHAASKEAASKEAAQDAEIKRLQKQIRLLTAAAKSKERTAVVMSATSAAN